MLLANLELKAAEQIYEITHTTGPKTLSSQPGPGQTGSGSAGAF